VRAEIPKDSALPVKLTELGYDPRHADFAAVDVIEIALSG
jgi:hypothetical protein